MTRAWAGVALALVAVSCGEGDGPRVIRFPQAVNAEHPRVVASQTFAERLAAETEGRLVVDIFPGGQLYGARQAAALGDVEMAMEPETHYITFDDAFRGVDMPFLFEGDEDFRRFLEGSFREKVESRLAERGLVVLALWDEGPMVLGSREAVLRTPDAFRGTKIRSSGHDLLARTWNELGATTVRLPIEEVYSALQQGVADAIYTMLYTFVAGKFHEVAPKTVIWPSRATYVWVVNRAFWERLTPEDRETARRLAGLATTDSRPARQIEGRDGSDDSRRSRRRARRAPSGRS